MSTHRTRRPGLPATGSPSPPKRAARPRIIKRIAYCPASAVARRQDRAPPATASSCGQTVLDPRKKRSRPGAPPTVASALRPLLTARGDHTTAFPVDPPGTWLGTGLPRRQLRETPSAPPGGGTLPEAVVARTIGKRAPVFKEMSTAVDTSLRALSAARDPLANQRSAAV